MLAAETIIDATTLAPTLEDNDIDTIMEGEWNELIYFLYCLRHANYSSRNTIR